MSLWSAVFAVLGVLALLGAAAWGRSTRRTVERLDRMLERALSGEFREGRYDESTLSRLEQKLSRFLSQSRITAGAVEEDRARVQSLIGDISHQTKTPLANILLYAQLLAEQDLPEAARPLCGQIGDQAEKLRFLIGSLVKTSRLESGAVQVRPVPGDLEDLLLALGEQYRPSAEAKGVSLTVEAKSTALQEDTPAVRSSSAGASADLRTYFDPRWTAEALGNLIDNAVKYTPAGGWVRVSAAPTPFFCRVTVVDSGPGIPEEEHPQVFERFYRGKNAAAQGVGLGLCLARQIVAAQGGYIRLRSALGEGAEFSVYLPRADGEKP